MSVCGCPREAAKKKKKKLKYWRNKGYEDGKQKEENEATKEDDLDEETKTRGKRKRRKGMSYILEQRRQNRDAKDASHVLFV